MKFGRLSIFRLWMATTHHSQIVRYYSSQHESIEKICRKLFDSNLPILSYCDTMVHYCWRVLGSSWKGGEGQTGHLDINFTTCELSGKIIIFLIYQLMSYLLTFTIKDDYILARLIFFTSFSPSKLTPRHFQIKYSHLESLSIFLQRIRYQIEVLFLSLFLTQSLWYMFFPLHYCRVSQKMMLKWMLKWRCPTLLLWGLLQTHFYHFSRGPRIFQKVKIKHTRMYIHTHIHIYIYTHTQTHRHTHTHTYTHTRIYTHTHTHVHTHIHIYKNTYIHTHEHTYTHVHIHASFWHVCF